MDRERDSGIETNSSSSPSQSQSQSSEEDVSPSPSVKSRSGQSTPSPKEKVVKKVTPALKPLMPRLRATAKEWSTHIVFIVGTQQERMFGLKSALIAKSQAFSEIVYAQKEVIHPEYNPSSFHIFLKYINSDNLCFAESHVCDLLRLAFVYDIPHIMNKCREFAMATLSLENVLKYHLAALLYELDDLQSLSFRFMVRQGPAFLNHPSFMELDAITLGSLIGRDDFLVIETDLFIRLLEWVNAECRRLHYPIDKPEFHRRVCGNLFQHVRFSMMTPKEFFLVVVPTKLLNQRDIDAIVLRHVTHPQLWSTLPSTQYVDRPRIIRPLIRVPLYKEVQSCFRRISTPSVKESVRFLASSDIYLMGFEFFGPGGNGPLTSFRIKYQLENEWMNQYWKTPVETMNILTPHDFEVELPHPYKINKQFPYKLTIWIEGQISQFGSQPLPQAILVFNNKHICIHFSDNESDLSKNLSFRSPQAESPGIIKGLLFQTID